MNTYIWHTEYNYYACMAETIEQARALVKAKFPNETQLGDRVNFDYEPEVILKPGDCVKVEHSNE